MVSSAKGKSGITVTFYRVVCDTLNETTNVKKTESPYDENGKEKTILVSLVIVTNKRTYPNLINYLVIYLLLLLTSNLTYLIN